MDADYSIELGHDDPVLDFPWTDPDGKLGYYDLKRHPDLLMHIKETLSYPELAEFLRLVNSHTSMFESAKCDVWKAEDLDAEEEIFGATTKCASYVDLIFSEVGNRRSFSIHELFVKRLIELLRKTPETASAVEACVRRCYFREAGVDVEGFYITLYVNGYGDDESRARQNWSIGLRLAGNAIVQLSASGIG